MTFWFVLSNSTQNGSAAGSGKSVPVPTFWSWQLNGISPSNGPMICGVNWAAAGRGGERVRRASESAPASDPLARLTVARAARRRAASPAAAPVAGCRAPGPPLRVREWTRQGEGDGPAVRTELGEELSRRELLARAGALGLAATILAAVPYAARMAQPAAAQAAAPIDAILQAFFDTLVPGKPVPDLRTELGNPIEPGAIAGVDPEHGAVYTDALLLARDPRIGFSLLEPVFLADLTATGARRGRRLQRPRLRGARARLPVRARVLEPGPARLGGGGGDPVHRLLRRRQRPGGDRRDLGRATR